MKFCALADLHLKLWSDIIYDECGVPKKLNEILGVFNSTCLYAKNNGIKNVVIAGDVNHLKSIVHYKSFVLFKRIIDEYKDLIFYIVSGNHDESAKEDNTSAIELITGDNVINIVSEPLIKENVTFLPWGKNLHDKLKKLKSNKCLISHFGINEAEFNSGISMRTGISLRDLKKFDLVILGHYHLPQTVGNVWYVGSPIQLNKGEKMDEKRFLVVDTETLIVESIPTEGYRKYYEFIIEKDSDDKEILNQAKLLTNQGNFVFVINKNPELIIKDESLRIINNIEKDYQMRGITAGMKVEDILYKYMKINNIPENIRDKYFNIGITVMNIRGEENEYQLS